MSVGLRVDEDWSMANFMQVVTTVDAEEVAERLARGVTGARLAACVQIVGPIKSVYCRPHKVGLLVAGRT